MLGCAVSTRTEPPSSGGHLQTNAALTTAAAAAAIAPDSTCGSEFSDSGSSSVSDDVVTSGRRQRQLVGVGGGHRGHEMATLVEKDDGDEIGAWVYFIDEHKPRSDFLINGH